MIVALTGLKGSGKDTAAGAFPEAPIYGFADELKRIARDVYGLTVEQCEDPTEKERSFAASIDMDAYMLELRRQTGLELVGRSKTARSPRELMQFLGTEYVRYVAPDYWIDAMIRKLSQSRLCFVRDCRYLNEAEAIRKIGGKIVRIERACAAGPCSLHPSETEQLSIQVDATVINDCTIPQLHHLFRRVVRDLRGY